MTDKKNCFVIMPFSKPYNERFEDTYKPGIEAAGLRAYRVDEDRTARQPIVSIHKEIEAAHVCFAEISTDKPNVWYELGYARAQRKELVLVCEKSRATALPFDLDRMRILFHSSESPKDFNALMHEITEEVLAVVGLVEKVDATKAAVSQFFMPTATPFVPPPRPFSFSFDAPNLTIRKSIAAKPTARKAAAPKATARKPTARKAVVWKVATPKAVAKAAARKPTARKAAVPKATARTVAARRPKTLTGVSNAVAAATAAFANANFTPLDVKVMETIVGICSDGKTSALETAIISRAKPIPGLDGRREVRISIMALERFSMVERVGTGLDGDPAYEPTSAGEEWFFANRGEKKR